MIQNADAAADKINTKYNISTSDIRSTHNAGLRLHGKMKNFSNKTKTTVSCIYLNIYPVISNFTDLGVWQSIVYHKCN